MAVVVESRRRLSGTIAAQDVETLENFDRLVSIRCTVSVAASLSSFDYVMSVDMDTGISHVRAISHRQGTTVLH